MSLWRTLEGRIGEMCELLHTRTPGIASQCFLAAACGGGKQHEQSVTAAAAHRTRYGAALSRVFVRDLGLHAPACARRGQARCPRVAHLRQTSEDAARTGHQGQGGEVPLPVSLDGRLREAPAPRSGCSCPDPLCFPPSIPTLSSLHIPPPTNTPPH